jgi:hypothetical protein
VTPDYSQGLLNTRPGFSSWGTYRWCSTRWPVSAVFHEGTRRFFSPAPVAFRRDNRGLRTRSGNTGAEANLPRFLDLVIWGHEVGGEGWMCE